MLKPMLPQNALRLGNTKVLPILINCTKARRGMNASQRSKFMSNAVGVLGVAIYAVQHAQHAQHAILRGGSWIPSSRERGGSSSVSERSESANFEFASLGAAKIE